MSSESSQPLTHSLTLPTQRNQLIQIVVAPSVSDSQFRTAIESSLFKQWLKNLESKNGILAIGSFLLKQVLVQVSRKLETSQANAVSEDKTNHASFVSMLDSHSYSIDRISSEIAYKALGGTDRHATTVALFNMLASYSRDTKLVLTLAAFALNYGEFWRFTLQSTGQIHCNSQAIAYHPGKLRALETSF
ncbi:hypothetical protein SADUNF_Sadunf17G0068400 [Salix dunnii]|uniref:Sieve element occlusion N-terminal domain-containing protein n=1 Tax=Salix dunnii TaxID=1413687 RepID=A0A835J5T9_9ROSI|nr:hypothetical protein SADUNF_Sadunf17G0068400 [Salix dunnii]